MASASTNTCEINVSSIEDKKKDLLDGRKAVVDQFYALKDRQSPLLEDVYVKNELVEVEKRLKEVLQLTKDVCEIKDGEIEELKKQISELKKEVSMLAEKVMKLTKSAQHADTIDAGEAMKIMERQVATFVLPETKEVGDNAIQDMIDYFKKDPSARGRWDDLSQKCDMSQLWTKNHKRVLKNLIQYRNVDAHHTKFNFELLLQAMFKKRPYHKTECEDIIKLFTAVNYLMKFGIIASEFMEIKERSDKCTKDSGKLMLRAKIWNKRRVENLQDIKLVEAKEHVARYFPDVSDSIWSHTISVIQSINRPRFGKLVKIKMAKVLKEVPQIFEHMQECHTLEELIKSSKKHRWRSERWKDGDRWRKVIDVIWWTKRHNDAFEAMKSLSPDNQQEDVDPLPLDVAKLHVTDFVEDDGLWEACSEIFKIFEWKKEEED